MKLACPVCSASIADAKRVWDYEFSDLLQCGHCGLIFHFRNNHFFSRLVTTHYSKNSWGSYSDDSYEHYINAPDTLLHMERMKHNVTFFSRHMTFDETSRVLDVGAGMGLLELAIETLDLPLKRANIVMMEPVPEICQILRKRFPSHVVVNSDINQIEEPLPRFDAIFCQGVDYLFGDLSHGFQVLHGLLKPDGLLFVSRNVFLDMSCYFGGEIIRSGKELFEPNPLINGYFLEPHYRAFLEQNFIIENDECFEERYSGNDVGVGHHFNYVLKKRTQVYNAEVFSDATFKTHYDAILNGLING